MHLDFVPQGRVAYHLPRSIAGGPVTRLELERPLVFFDLESTGTDPDSDKIVEIAALRLTADGERETRTRRLNPGRPIPPGATAVHGITDADVKDAPSFRQIARSLLQFLEGADLAGFNIGRFDLPLLDREFRECDLDLDVASRKLIDVMRVYHRKEPRDLSAAVRFYLGREHVGAHGAEADILATAEVLEAQLGRYDDLPHGVDALADWCDPRPENAIDRRGKLAWRDGEAVLTFGRHRDRTLRELVEEAPDYLEWILGSDFPDDAREIVRRALAGEFPVPDGPAG
jgi:DNA polymerase-3 subunit epsilon